jgi:phage-related minor tail protein
MPFYSQQKYSTEMMNMVTSKGVATKEDLKNFKEEIVHRFHVISEDVISQVKQVAEGVVNVNEKLDRMSQELKNEIQETRQEILAAVKFSYAELDKRITTPEKDFLDLKHRVERIESRSTP